MSAAVFAPAAIDVVQKVATPTNVLAVVIIVGIIIFLLIIGFLFLKGKKKNSKATKGGTKGGSTKGGSSSGGSAVGNVPGVDLANFPEPLIEPPLSQNPLQTPLNTFFGNPIANVRR